MIRVAYVEDPFSGCIRRTWEAAWGPGVTARTLLPDDAGEYVACWRNGTAVEGDDWDAQLSPDDHIQFVEVPGIFGVAGALSTFYAAGAATAATSAITAISVAKLVANLLVSFAIGKLLGPRVGPLTPSDQDSPTYRFGGITSNRQAEGAPIPVLYGWHDTGGLEIAKYTATSVDGVDLWVLIALSDGPVHEIGGYTSDQDNLTSENGDLPEGLKVNGQPAGNYDGIRCWLRLGTDEQSSIPGFESAVVQYSVDQTLAESVVDGPGNVQLTPGIYDPTDPTDEAALDKWDTAVTHDFVTEIDAFECLIDFPQGLYAISSTSAALQQNTAKFQIRYRELSGGTPIGDYVVLPPEPTVTRSKSSPFTVAFRHDVVLPSTYSPPTPGLYADFGTGKSGSVSSPSGIIDKPKAQVEWTVSTWIRDNNSSSSSTYYTLADQLSASAGWKLELRYTNKIPGLTNTPRVYTAFWTFGDGASTSSATLPAIFELPSDSEIHHLALVYSATSATAGEVKFYIDGGKRYTFAFNAMVLAPSTAINLCASGAWDMDDFRYWQRALNDGEIAGQYAGGVGATSSGTESQIVMSVDFDTVSAVEALDATANSNDVTFAGGADVAADHTGVVTTATAGTPNRATYRVEIQRLNEDDELALDQATAKWTDVKGIQFDEYTYPGTALMGVRIRATDQLSGTAPTITTSVKGRLAPIWDGVDADHPSFTMTWTRNPAWIALDLLTNEEHGLGPNFKIDRDPVLADFKTLADFCDELTGDGHDKLDMADASLGSVTYSAGSVTISLTGIPEASPYYEVGDFIAITDKATDTSYNTDDGVAIELTSVTYTPSGLDVILVGTWPASQTAPTPSSTAADGKIEKRETRFVYDGVFDRPGYGAWDGFVAVLQTCRAKPILSGKRVGIFIDRPRDSVGLVTMGNVVGGSFESSYSSIKERPNAVAIEILDREDNFARTWVEREHSTVNDPSSQEAFRRRQIRRDGVTRRSQALRDATYQLNVSYLLNRRVGFKLDTEGLYLRVGDRFGVAHDVPGWGTSGRLRAGESDTEVQLDRSVTLAAATTYVLQIQDVSTGAVDTQTVSTSSGTYAAGSTITVSSAFSFDPDAGDVYSLGETGAEAKDFQVVDISTDPGSLTRTVEALEYNASVYSDDFGEILDSISTLTPPPSEDAIPQAPTSLSVEDGHDVSGDGTSSQYLDVSWEYDGDNARNVYGAEVWLEDPDVGVPVKVADVPGQATYHRLNATGLVASSTYRVYVRPYSRNRRMRYLRANPYTEVYLEGLVQPPNRPGNVGTRQAGDQVVYNWVPSGSPQRIADEVRNGGWILGQRICEAVKGANNFGPTSSWLTLPANTAGVDVPTFQLRTIGHTGQYSRAREFTTSFTGQGDVMYETSVEDEGTGWTGATLSDLAVTGTTPDAVVNFSGTATSGYVEWTVSNLREASWYYIYLGYVAEQIHPLTWDEANWTWDSIEAKRWIWEGPLSGTHNGLGNMTLRSFITTSETTAVSTSLKRYIPGLHYGRTFKFRLQFIRPNDDYDVSLSRMAIRIVRPHDRFSNPLRSEVFA